jgi:predicted TIM-barrel fold metal-dependent hydrolase
LAEPGSAAARRKIPFDPLPIVDAHHHLWDAAASGIRYPWHGVSGSQHHLGDTAPIWRPYLPAEYRRDSALHNVVATVHVEAECNRAQQVTETEWLTALAAREGMPNAIVAHAWVDTPDAEEILAAHKRFPLVRGVRTKPVIATDPKGSVRGAPRSLQDPKWIAGLALLQKYDLAWDLRVPWWHLAEAAEVTRHYPAMRIVLNHTGYPLHRDGASLAEWRRGMAALAACENVHVKLSGLTVVGRPWTLEDNKPLIHEAIAMFGVERCMFASNFPVDGLWGSWDYLYRCFKAAVADRSLADREKLFAGNAARFYRIDL